MSQHDHSNKQDKHVTEKEELGQHSKYVGVYAQQWSFVEVFPYKNENEHDLMFKKINEDQLRCIISTNKFNLFPKLSSNHLTEIWERRINIGFSF